MQAVFSANVGIAAAVSERDCALASCTVNASVSASKYDTSDSAITFYIKSGLARCKIASVILRPQTILVRRFVAILGAPAF